jgi:hypothetical protein
MLFFLDFRIIAPKREHASQRDLPEVQPLQQEQRVLTI